MAEDNDLLVRIAHLAGQINLHRDEQNRTSSQTHPFFKEPSIPPKVYSHSDARGSPFAHRGRIKKAFRQTPRARHHKSLIIKPQGTAISQGQPLCSNTIGSRAGPQIASDPRPSTGKGWVLKSDRHRQLISSSVYEREAISRLESRKANQRKKASIASKSHAEVRTSKHHKLLCQKSFPTQSTSKTFKFSPQCERFTKTGRCPMGSRCAFDHDPTKVAICRDYLRCGRCPQGGHCDLSHEISYERVPACIHFVRGNCSKAPCNYPHVRVNATAPVCRAFSILGYCGSGSACTERHVFECPEFSENGECHAIGCRLPHVLSAAQMRNRTSANPVTSEPGLLSEAGSRMTFQNPSEIGRADEDSGGLQQITPQTATVPEVSGLSQQQDFVRI